MRRYSKTLLLIVAVALLVGAVGCGGSSEAGGNQTPQAVMVGAALASQNMKSASGSFDVTMKLDADSGQAPPEMKAFVDNPIKVSGTFAVAQDPEAADLTLSMQLGGQPIEAALKAVDGKLWIQFGDQWYELPADMMGAGATDATTPSSVPDVAQIMKLLTDVGVDPTTWIKDLALVGEEKIDGAASYHLKGTPDVAKMITDVIQLLQSPEFSKLLVPTGEGVGAAGQGLESLMPSPDELQEMQTQITEMFKDFTVEAWVDKAESFLRKAVVTAHITPPAGEETDGLNAIDLSATVSLQNFNQPVSVQPPASAKPIAELGKAIEDNPGLLGPLGGLLGGLMGGMGTGGIGLDGLGTDDTTFTN